MIDTNKRTRKGKNKLIKYEQLVEVYDKYGGDLFIDSFGSSSSVSFVLCVALLRKCCGFTYLQVAKLYGQKTSHEASKAMRRHAQFVCIYHSEFSKEYKDKFASLLAICKAMGNPLSGYERIKRYRAKRRKK